MKIVPINLEDLEKLMGDSKKLIEEITRKMKPTMMEISLLKDGKFKLGKVNKNLYIPFSLSDFRSGHLHKKPGVYIKPRTKEARFVMKSRKKGKEQKVVFIAPTILDTHYPIRAFYNEPRMITVLAFNDGSRTKVIASDEKRNSPRTGVIIALAKRILGTDPIKRNSINSVYSNFSDPQAEAAFYGVVLSYFMTNGIVKDPATFDLWIAEFMASNLEISKSKEPKSKE